VFADGPQIGIAEAGAENAVAAEDGAPAVEYDKRRHDVDAVLVPQRVLVVIDVHHRESKPRILGPALHELRLETTAEGAPRGREHDDGRASVALDFGTERVHRRELERRSHDTRTHWETLNPRPIGTYLLGRTFARRRFSGDRMGPPACSDEMDRYFAELQRGAATCYDLARRARALGFDPELDVEIPQTDDLASRVERLLKDYDVAGVAHRIRELAKGHDREETAILVAKELARKPAPSVEKGIERAVRVGLAILTEGILVAPLEGLADVRVKRNPDGSSYVDLYYAGPIRSAGGTGQALSVLIADVVRREFGIDRYKPLRAEVERFREEIPLYRQAQHLQYTPTDEEIDLIASNCPVGINGEGTEDVEISGHRDLKRIETNRVRGGACLVLADGLCLKAPKVLKHVRTLRIDGWDFIEAYVAMRNHRTEEGVDNGGVEPNDAFIENLVAGRPVLCRASCPGGLRLRYGRSRGTGLAALGMHPATMAVLDEFIAVGTQIKTERPGKAGAITPCDAIEGPIVLLDTGELVEVNTLEEGRSLRPRIRLIADLGELLVPFGEFLENNHVLVPGAFSTDWYRAELEAAAGVVPPNWSVPSVEEALSWSEQFGVPLHPRYNLFWHDLTVGDIRRLRDHVLAAGRIEGETLVMPTPADIKDLLVRLGATHRVVGGDAVLDRYATPLLRCLGIAVRDGRLAPLDDVEADSALDLVSKWARVPVKARAPTRIGARMARPEKAAPRLMQPPPHALFPVGREGGLQRLLREVARKDVLEVEVGIRVCASCGKRWFLPRCTCGGHTVSRGRPSRQRIPIGEVCRAAVERTGALPDDVKGVQGMISATKTPEPLEKGLLRAKHGVHVFKDGTTRFDMTNLPLTHFEPREAGLTAERARALGYLRDVRGRPLNSADQVVELRPQDLIASTECGAFLVRVAGFLDDLLEKVYGLPRFYRAARPEDLVGHHLATLAPHTSGGVLARLIGFTPARACFAHPLLVAARRRNCDGDEDSVILLLDALLNFSRSFLPEKRGGLMDAPLVLSTRIDPAEIDKEAHNLDVAWSYPLSLYRAAERFAHPREVEAAIDTIGKRVGSVLQYEGFGYTAPTSGIAAAPLVSAYVEGSMVEKLDSVLGLAMRIRAVEASDVVARVLVHHFLPDLIGNLKAFSSQMVRCTSCNTKYRRLPLKGKCLECGGHLTLTVHENSVKKYLELSKRISEQYRVSPYLRQRIALVEEAITSLFANDRAQSLKLDDFF